MVLIKRLAALVGHFVDILLLAHGSLKFKLEEADGQLGRVLVW